MQKGDSCLHDVWTDLKKHFKKKIWKNFMTLGMIAFAIAAIKIAPAPFHVLIPVLIVVALVRQVGASVRKDIDACVKNGDRQGEPGVMEGASDRREHQLAASLLLYLPCGLILTLILVPGTYQLHVLLMAYCLIPVWVVSIPLFLIRHFVWKSGANSASPVPEC